MTAPRRHALALCLAALFSAGAFAQGKDIRIAHIYSKSGPLEAYGKQTHTGLMLGLQYATGGSMVVAGRKLVVLEKDDQGKPDVGKNLLAAAYADERADLAVGPTSSSVALALLPVAEEAGKLLIVEPAVADSITGEKWNPFIFRTGRNSSQDAIANFREALKTAKLVHEEYLPTTTTDFTAGAQRLIDKLKGLAGRKIIFILWAGAGNPFKIADLDLKRHGIEIATGGNILPAMTAYRQFPGMEGAAYYYFGMPKNPVNEWLVANHYKQYKAPPDMFTAGGMSAGIAIVEALKKTGGDTKTPKLQAALKGLSFMSPKGEMTIRPQDHQAMQSMFHFKIKVDPAFEWGVPELVREIKPAEMNIPVRNGK